MTADDRIESLLDAWHAALTAGREVPLAELCRDCPELIPEVARRADLLRKFLDLAATSPCPAAPPAPPP